MSLRFYLCPLVGDGLSEETAYRPQLAGLANFASMIPHNPDGTPKFNWCVAVARQADWTALDADAQLERLFGIDLPDTIDTFAELKAYLQSKTVGDIPVARRQAINDKLTARGIDTSQITLATTWWQVLRGIYKKLNNGVDPVRNALAI
jgi:hypothetical protein